MKKVILILLMLSMTIFVFGDEVSSNSKMAIGIGPEWNMNSRDNFAAGAVLTFDFNIGSSFAVGITATASSNFDEIFVIEPAAMFRWYFLGSDHTGWFVQADAGAYLVLEDGDVIPLFLGGLRGGLRLPLGDRFFVEPFGRVGYPFAFGVGALVGLKL